MKIEIDQSGKVEETQHDTVVAFSNGIFYSVNKFKKFFEKWKNRKDL